MAHFISENKVKLGLSNLTSNISENCGNTKTSSTALSTPDMRLSDFRRTGL